MLCDTVITNRKGIWKYHYCIRCQQVMRSKTGGEAVFLCQVFGWGDKLAWLLKRLGLDACLGCSQRQQIINNWDRWCHRKLLTFRNGKIPPAMPEPPFVENVTY